MLLAALELRCALLFDCCAAVFLLGVWAVSSIRIQYAIDLGQICTVNDKRSWRLVRALIKGESGKRENPDSPSSRPLKPGLSWVFSGTLAAPKTGRTLGTRQSTRGFGFMCVPPKSGTTSWQSMMIAIQQATSITKVQKFK